MTRVMMPAITCVVSRIFALNASYRRSQSRRLLFWCPMRMTPSHITSFSCNTLEMQDQVDAEEVLDLLTKIVDVQLPER